MERLLERVDVVVARHRWLSPAANVCAGALITFGWVLTLR